MKGLLLKDLALLKGQKKFFLVVIVLAIGMAVATEDITFILGYVTLIIPMFALSSLSYDEFDNGYSFLFTLPVSRVTYVMEKYCFALLLGVGAAVISVALTILVGMVRGQLPFREMITALGGIFALMLVLQAVLLPLQIKFGAEKGRMAMLAVGGVAGAIGFLVINAAQWLGIDMAVLTVTLQNMGPVLITVLLAAAVAVILLISMRISVGIIRKKEY